MKDIQDIYLIEPKLAVLYGKIPEIIQRDKAWDFGWAEVKRKFSRLVGMEAERVQLRSSGDYDLIYRHFLAEAERYCRD